MVLSTESKLPDNLAKPRGANGCRISEATLRAPLTNVILALMSALTGIQLTCCQRVVLLPFVLLCHACSWCKAARANPRNSHVGLYKRSVTSALVVYSHSQLIWLTRRTGEEPDWLGLYMIIVLNAASLNCFCCQLCSCFILPHSYRVLTFVFLTVVSYVITFTSSFSFSRLQLIYKKVFLLSSGFFCNEY